MKFWTKCPLKGSVSLHASPSTYGGRVVDSSDTPVWLLLIAYIEHVGNMNRKGASICQMEKIIPSKSSMEKEGRKITIRAVLWGDKFLIRSRYGVSFWLMLTKDRLLIFFLPLEKMCLVSSPCYCYGVSWPLEGLGMGCPAPRKELRLATEEQGKRREESNYKKWSVGDHTLMCLFILLFINSIKPCS